MSVHKALCVRRRSLAVPTRKALQTANGRGYSAAQLGKSFVDNPYVRLQARAYNRAWTYGWIAYMTRNNRVAIECEQCNRETLYPDMVGGLDVWLCSECGFVAPNLELQAMAQYEQQRDMDELETI